MTERSLLPRLVNVVWRSAKRPRHAQLRRALEDPRRAQQRLLREYLSANAATEWGRRFGFDRIGSVRDFQRRVPLTTYEDYVDALERIRRGERAVLTAAPVRRLVPTSGSVAARKLIPYTATLQAEFDRAIGAWIVDLFGRHPRAAAGRSYWSVSPAVLADPGAPGDVPIGFEDDAEYVAGWIRRPVQRTLAVPAAVRHVEDAEVFRYVTLLFLLRAADLSLISVWHPTFLGRLLQSLPEHFERLLRDVHDGTTSPPGPLSVPGLRAVRPRAPRRAVELARAGPHDPRALWPRLALISAWGDGAAAGALDELARAFPGVALQPKGLIATEAFVSLPLAGLRPVAVCSHFFEFLDDAGDARSVHELCEGEEYSVVVTTGGGLYRYRLGDRVRAGPSVGATPSLTFLGREEGVVDLFGEKLHPGFVGDALARLFAEVELETSFALLAPSKADQTTSYVLYVQAARARTTGLSDLLERLLCENLHYAYCRKLGQLGPARVQPVGAGAHAAYLDRIASRGTLLGNVKPVQLCGLSGWEGWLPRLEPEGTVTAR